MPTTRFSMVRTYSANVAGLVFLLLATGAQAQVTPLFGNAGPFLNRADFDLADAAARKLLEPQPAAIGTVADWTDPASGNSGSLTMGRAYRKHGRDCRSVSWHDAFKAGEKRTVALDTCRIAGVWKLM